ncbi:RB1-inducible coiled-coil protein 1 isoform X2 [Sabethes cyaneus]|uniref:RB1-inducible coiled-coil protein 1 isoform X2 n=1 Tax=Sabethes cyaneus TaxID=53552 RepID=UPI00237EAB6E|nr:RB1-inducible coiled-coil protein 1 isoform X2 [Sabethes cyaneus]
MLYVFHVDTGRMLKFEMNKAFENVRSLKETIERHHGIPANSVVLLVSGGEVLQDPQRVCNYSAGTDTNPIYMFSTCLLDTKNQPPPWPSIESDNDLKILVDKCLEMPANYQTVVARAQLALQICEMAKEEVKACETLVHEQHLQQQGWAAVVANMEDAVTEFQERVVDYYRRYDDHQQRSAENKKMLSDFGEALKQLSEIPILSTLMENAESRPYGAFDEVYADASNIATSTSTGSSKTASNHEPTSTSAESATGPEGSGSIENGTGSEPTAELEAITAEKVRANCVSLLDWISASEGQKTLQRMANECLEGLGQFESPRMTTLKDKIEIAIDLSQREDMKEIKGLEERLCGLDRLMFDAKKIVQDQNELAQSFQQNQNRANTLGDTSILPDLCASHRSQLVVMLKNHNLLRDIRRRCAKAKDELGCNLFQRLKYIIHVETKVSEIDNTLLFYHSCLKRLQKHLGIIEQIHMAPCMYVTAVTEVVRRKMFSTAFLRWASDLACRLMAIHNEEVMRRHEFTSQFEGHFLSSLFPGMDDMPPSYGIQAPPIFDSSLPGLNKQDLQELTLFLPELTEKIQLPNIDSVIDFFSSKPVEANESKSNITQEASAGDAEEKVTEILEASSAEMKIPETEKEKSQLQPKDDEKACESETDTEEFEKVGQSPIDRRHRARPKVDTCNIATSTERVLQTSAETLTEENLGATRIEVERLKVLLRDVCQLSQSSIVVLREQLSALRSENAAHQTEFKVQLEAINRSWVDIQKAARNQERETVQQLTVDHELEMNDLRKSIHQKDDEIQSLRSDNSTMKANLIETVSKYESEKKELTDKIEEMKEVVCKLEKQLADVSVDRKKAIQEAIEQLEHKHKTDIESLRCRYKLMTSMDRSPSDTSLEKIEKPDMIDIASHEQLLSQVREDFNREKERAIKIAIEEERQRWELSSQQKSLAQPQRSIGSSPGTPTSSQDVFKRILEEKERQLDEMRDKESHLIKENQRYRETIQSLTDPELCSNQIDFKKQIELLEREKLQLTRDLEIQQNRLSVAVSTQTCLKGNTVLVEYNSTYNQYTIVQNSPVLYFLHADSYPAFNMTPLVVGEVPLIVSCIGIVTDKDYCHARKDENRYKVSRGTRFYRVKVKPLSSGSSSTGGSYTSRSVDFEKHSSKKEKSKVTTLSRSSSTITEQSATAGTSGLLVDSFAQTEQTTSSPPMEDSSIRPCSTQDMVDSAVAEELKSTSKERNISVTDEEEATYSGSASGSVDAADHDRLRYQSVCEEDEEVQPEDNNSNTTLMLLRAFLLLNDDE